MNIECKAIVTNCKILQLKENEMIAADDNKITWKTVTFMTEDGISQDITCDKDIFPLLKTDSKEDLVIHIQGEKKTGYTSIKARIVDVVKKPLAK